MSIDRRLASKGRGEPLQALVAQGRYHAGLAVEHADALAADNWTPAQTAALLAEVEGLDTDRIRQLDARAGSQQSTRLEAEAVRDAKDLINRVRNVVRQVLRKHPDAGVTLEDFRSGGPLGRSTPKVSAYLLRLKVPVAKLDQAFAPFFKNQPLSTLLEEVRRRLDAANATQEVDLASLPEDTQKLYERKGRLLEYIEDLNAVARNTFNGATPIRAAFNKEILNRGRRPKKAPEVPSPGPSPD
jgi:hypothetical protein